MLHIVALMLSDKLSLAKLASLYQLLQPAEAQQDDWFLYFERILSLSSPDLVEKLQCEFPCVKIRHANMFFFPPNVASK